MSGEIRVEELSPNQWERLRDIRLAALRNDGHAFGGNLEAEGAMSENEWRAKFEIFTGLIAVLDGVDIGFMSVENLNGDFRTTCWIGSCWVGSEHRRKGALRALFEYVDQLSHERNWKIQGLGVWIDNDGAIRAYEKLGFSQMGEPQESTRKPGLYYQRMVKTVTS
jgi:RimJ/RimL family protein N-acetyltransferase